MNQYKTDQALGRYRMITNWRQFVNLFVVIDGAEALLCMYYRR